MSKNDGSSSVKEGAGLSLSIDLKFEPDTFTREQIMKMRGWDQPTKKK